jgi:hypothetical protein
MKVAWERLIRFVATDGRVLKGEPILPSEDFDLGRVNESTKLQAKVIQGDDVYDTTGETKVTDEIVTVKKLLGPLAQGDVDILRCVGLNYAKHSELKDLSFYSTSMLTISQSKRQEEAHHHFPSYFSNRRPRSGIMARMW